MVKIKETLKSGIVTKWWGVDAGTVHRVKEF